MIRLLSITGWNKSESLTRKKSANVVIAGISNNLDILLHTLYLTSSDFNCSYPISGIIFEKIYRLYHALNPDASWQEEVDHLDG